MRRIDRLVVGELLGPWTFGVGLFTALLFAGGVLNRLASYLVGGADTLTVLKLIGLLIPALLVKTFSMSMLLAGLLGFGRLSSDSEIVALRAGGASLPRILRPVVLAAVVVSLVTFAFNELVVPRAARAAVVLGTRLAAQGMTGGRAFAHEVVQKGKVVAMIDAVRADLATQTMHDVAVVAYDKDQKPSVALLAPLMQADAGDLKRWRIVGEARIVPLNGDPREVVKLHGGAWPEGIPKVAASLDDLLIKKDDYDAFTLAELRDRIAQMRRDGDKEPSTVRDYEYGYWNKFTVAFAALVFGTLGAVLGIRNHRTGTAAGFALAVGIIFGYIALANFMNVWAQGGVLPPWAASFAPLCIGSVACGVIIYRRNV